MLYYFLQEEYIHFFTEPEAAWDWAESLATDDSRPGYTQSTPAPKPRRERTNRRNARAHRAQSGGYLSPQMCQEQRKALADAGQDLTSTPLWLLTDS